MHNITRFRPTYVSIRLVAKVTGSQARPKSAFIFRSGFGYANADRGILLSNVDVEKFCRSSYKLAVAIQDHVVGTLHLQKKQNWLDHCTPFSDISTRGIVTYESPVHMFAIRIKIESTDHCPF